MSDVQVGTGLPKKTKKRAEQPATQISYDDKAIAKGKKLAATLKSGDEVEWELGKMADQLETKKYGNNTLARFAKDIGLPADRLNWCRSVYRKYKDKDIKGPALKFAVLQALQAHPLRDKIIEERPNLTKREARTLMKDHHLAQGRDEEWRVIETRRWFAQAEKHAQELIKYGHPAREYLDPTVLLQALDNKDQMFSPPCAWPPKPGPP